jgi:DNA-directed RNA polymerase specialized sigma24 family protein
LSLRETADIMGKSVSAIKSLQFRAIDTLRSILVQERSK